MSGTPKHTNASLEAERRRRVQEEREERAREEALRRAAEEARRAAERRDRVREAAGSQAVALLTRLSALEAAAGSRFVPTGPAADLRAGAQQAVDNARAAATEDAARAAQRLVGELAGRLDRLTAEVRAASQAADQLAAEAADAEAELTRTAASASARYLPAGGPAGWGGELDRVRQAVNDATDAEALRRAAAELSRVRGEVRRAAADADAAGRDAATADADARRLTEEIDAFAAGSLAPHAETGRVASLAATAGRLAAELSRAADRAAVADVRRALAAARDEFREAAGAAAANQRSAHLAAEGQELARLRGEVEALDPARSRKFDPTGWADLEAQLDAADGRLAGGQLEAGRQALAAARTGFDAHRREVARRFRQWQAERDTATQATAAARTAVETVRGDARRVRWVATPLHDLDRRLQDADRQVVREEFVPAAAAAREVGRDAARVGTLADDLAAEADRLTELRARAAAVQPTPGRTFDPTGARDTARHLDAADTALKANKLDDARTQVAAAQDRLARHEAAALAAAARWQQESDAAAAALAAARDRLAAFVADPVVGKWQGPALAEWDGQLTRAAADLAAATGDPDLDRPRFAAAARTAAALTAAGPKLVAGANEFQVQADLQTQISDGVTRVMAELGFHVQTVLENPGDPRSAVVLQATRDNGDLIDVAVEHHGRIEYSVGGRLEKAEEVQVVEGRSKVVKKCDEAEAQILRMHELLLGLGINTDGLKWDDQPPDDDGAAAENPELARLRLAQQRIRAVGRK